MNTLIVVDMQKDFIDGALANPKAAAIVDAIAAKVEAHTGPVIFTRDTHFDGLYEASLEGVLPKHCIQGTDGWMIDEKIAAAAKGKFTAAVDKVTFGHTKWNDPEDPMLQRVIAQADAIELVGTVAEICVAANAIMLRAMFPDKKIIVYKDMIAGLPDANGNTPGKDAAIAVLQAQQIEVV